MNRIRELRETLGMSVEELAARVDTSGTQIRRLEGGSRRLTEDWMRRIAGALECSPADLFANAVIVSAEDEVEPADTEIAGLAVAIARKGLHLYRVKSDSVSLAGIAPGDLITVDQSPEAIAAAESAAIVLARLSGPPALVLRQYLRPNLVTTNRPGANVAVLLGDRSVPLSLVGVVIRD